MSDSSEEEDISRFKEAVDSSFVKLIAVSRDQSLHCTKIDQPRSERYLEEASHYNDIRVPKELQKRIGDKISAILDKLVVYVDCEYKTVKQRKIKGGVKLFRDSEGFLSCEEAKDNYTEAHNRISKKLKWPKRKIRDDTHEYNECEKIKAAVVTGDYVLCNKDKKNWRSRRKEKLFKYKAVGKNKNILIKIKQNMLE